MSFGKLLPLEVSICDEVLPIKESCKHLRRHVDRNIPFYDPINHVVKKLNSICEDINKIKDVQRSFFSYSTTLMQKA